MECFFELSQIKIEVSPGPRTSCWLTQVDEVAASARVLHSNTKAAEANSSPPPAERSPTKDAVAAALIEDASLTADSWTADATRGGTGEIDRSVAMQDGSKQGGRDVEVEVEAEVEVQVEVEVDLDDDERVLGELVPSPVEMAEYTTSTDEDMSVVEEETGRVVNGDDDHLCSDGESAQGDDRASCEIQGGLLQGDEDEATLEDGMVSHASSLVPQQVRDGAPTPKVGEDLDFLSTNAHE